VIQTLQLIALSAALLLIVSGCAKLRDPQPAARMITRVLPGMHRPLLPSAVRVVAVAELGVGGSAAALGGRWPFAALAAMYLGFAAVVLLAMRRGGDAACGCFGVADAPLGRAHLILDLLAAAMSVGACVSAPDRFAGIGALAPLPAVVASGQVLLLGWLGYLALTALPSLAATRRLVLEDNS
jgi:hypothetical protein